MRVSAAWEMLMTGEFLKKRILLAVRDMPETSVGMFADGLKPPPAMKVRSFFNPSSRRISHRRGMLRLEHLFSRGTKE